MKYKTITYQRVKNLGNYESERMEMTIELNEGLSQNLTKTTTTTMTTMTTISMNNIPPPDPSWDYYIHYHKLLRAKSKIEELTQWLVENESAADELDASLDDDLLAIIKVLEDTRNYEVRSPDEPD